MQGARGNRDGSYSIIHNTISQGNIGFIDQHSLSLDRSFYEVGRKDNSVCSRSSMQGVRGNQDGSYSIIHNTISQGDIGFIDQHGLSLDHSLYEVGRNDNEPADASSPIKPGGFLPMFFKDRKLLSPIVQLPAVCSKGTRFCSVHIYNLIKNSQAVKKDAAPIKAMVKKDVKSKVAAKKWL